MPRRVALALTVALTLPACQAGAPARPAAAQPASVAAAPTSRPLSAPSPSAAPSTTVTPASPPAATPPAFRSAVRPVTAAGLGRSWHPGCPVPPERLRALDITFWTFAGHPAAGTVVVDAGVTAAVARIFHRLFAARFPIRSVRPTAEFGGSDDSSMAADNTSGFTCRYAVAPGPPTWSAHSFGRAVDVNPVENPYVEGGQVRPPAGRAHLDRTAHEPGTAWRGGVVVSAFAAEGWQWGGRWSATPDYQHFSADGR